MNISRVVWSIGLITSSIASPSAEFIKRAGESLRKSSEKIFVEITEEKRLLRQTLEQERKVLEQQQQEFQQNGKTELEDLDAAIALVKVDLSQAQDNELLAKKLAILNELYQIYKDQYLARCNTLAILDKHGALLTSYLEDHEFIKFKKEHKFKEYLIYYSFSDVQYLHKMILTYEHRLAQLLESEKNAHTELNHRKQGVAAAALAYKQKQEEREKAVKNSMSDTDTKLLIDLLNLEEQLYKNRQRLDELRLKEIERKVQLIETKKFIVEEQLRILRHELRRIKPSVKVTEADLTVAKEALSKQRQEHTRLAEVYRKRLNIILAERQEKEKTLTTLSKRYNIPLNPELDTWRLQPQDTLSSYVGICQVGALNSYLLLLDTKRTLIDLMGTLDDIKLGNERLQIQIKETFYKIGARKFVTQESIMQEMQQYEAPKADARANLSLYRAKMNDIDELSKQQREVLDAIITLRQDIQDKQTKLFRTAAKEYFTCIDVMSHAELAIKERIEVLKKINSTYSLIISEIEQSLRYISFIIAELNSITIWHRPDYAISWEGIKNIIPDLEFFAADLHGYLKSLTPSVVMFPLYQGYTHPWDLLWGMLMVLFLIVMVCGYAWCARYVSQVLMGYGYRYSSTLFGFLATWIATALLYAYTFLYLVAPWMCIYILVQWYTPVLSAYLIAWFYILSIPYFFLLIIRWKRYVMSFNVSHDYRLLSAEFQRRFMLVTITLAYCLTVTVLLRQAFVSWITVSNYSNSELPPILLATSFILFQVGLLFLVSKKRVLSIIPDSTELWHWIRGQINRYYSFLLLMFIVLIVLGNPYVGFGRLMAHLIRALLYTMFLSGVMLWVYGLCKNILSRMFFVRDGDVVREKFEHAKSWFGIIVIALFIGLSILGLFLIARIWGSQLTLHDMNVWLYKPLIPDLKPPITISSILHLIMFVMGGFLISYGFDHFILDKIFDLLLIDMGVQYTITSIARYLIVIAAIFLGFQQVGLGSLIVYIVGALALGIGWILKEPISDFVAYFIILVQRPVKIGDYIQIDDNTMGVVRRISPRALVLRRRNSTTIVVPNSYLVNRTITNWNYVRKYIAFDDITLTVHFTQDPEVVRQLLQEATQIHQKVLKNPAPIVRLDNFGEYGYQFMVRGFISDVYTLDQWDIASEVRLFIVKKLREHQIELAIPVRAYAPYIERAGTGDAAMSGGRIPEGQGIKE